MQKKVTKKELTTKHEANFVQNFGKTQTWLGMKRMSI